MYPDIERDIGDSPLPVVNIHRELVEVQLLLEEIPEVVLEKVATCSLLDRFRPREVPRHCHSEPGNRYKAVFLTISQTEKSHGKQTKQTTFFQKN